MENRKCQTVLCDEYIPLIPLIGVGVGGYDYNITYASVAKALKIGYRLIDTAESYHNEEAVGDAIIDSGIDRKEIIIISKYFGGINYGNPNDVMNSFTKSLKKLKTNYIDIYLVHVPFGCKWGNGWEPYNLCKIINYKHRISVWLQLIELKKLKLVNYIGVSNWTIDNINELKINKLCIPDIIQIEWCPSFYSKELYNYCVDNHIKIIGYGLFSRNSINEIDSLELNNKNKKPSEILIKWCVQKKIIVIPRSNKYENLLNNYNTVNKELWNLCDKDIERIDNIPQKLKGHCLENVYENNHHINLWKPIILNNNDDLAYNENENKLYDLINGNISCIIINNLIIENDCRSIINRMEEKNLLKDQLPYNNYDIDFRTNEIGITIDHLWRNDPIRYFNECIKVNKLFDTIFDDNLNPFEILFETIKKIVGNKYNILQHQRNNILCPKGVFRIFTKSSQQFPYHTDGFNYGDIINNLTTIDRNLYPTIMNCNTNSIIAIILILQQTDDIKNEIELYNCLVNDLEGYKDEIGMYSHWMGTKYSNDHILKIKLEDKQFYSPILNTGDLYIFSASRIHKLNNFIKNNNRIVLATFGCIKDNDIILYQ